MNRSARHRQRRSSSRQLSPVEQDCHQNRPLHSSSLRYGCGLWRLRPAATVPAGIWCRAHAGATGYIRRGHLALATDEARGAVIVHAAAAWAADALAVRCPTVAVRAAVAGTAVAAIRASLALARAGVGCCLALLAKADVLGLTAARSTGNRRIVGTADQPRVATLTRAALAKTALAGTPDLVALRRRNAATWTPG